MEQNYPELTRIGTFLSAQGSLFFFSLTYIVLRGEDMKVKDKEEVLRVFSLHIRQILERADPDFTRLQEIRLRAGRPLVLVEGGQEAFLTGDGERTRDFRRAWVVTAQELRGNHGVCGEIFPLRL